MNLDKKPKKKRRIALTVVALTVACLGLVSLIYLSFNLGALKQKKSVLLKDFKLIEKEMKAISSTLEEKDSQLEDLNEKINQLS